MTPPPPDPFDRALAAYSAREQARPLPPPPGFADRATAAVLARRPWLWLRWAAGTVFGLVVVAGVGYFFWPTSPPPEPAPVLATPEPATPNIGDALSGAGDAVARLTRSTAEKATPPRALLAPVETAKAPPVGADVPPAADTLAAVPAAARSGLEPVTGSTRRAFHRLLRDTGLRPN